MKKNDDYKVIVSEAYKMRVLEALRAEERQARRYLSVNQIGAVMGVTASQHLRNALWALAADGFLMMRDRDGDDTVLEYAIKKELRDT